MSTPAIRAALVALLNSVPDIGRVHGYERFARATLDFRALYMLPSDAVRGWYVRRLGERRRLVASGRVLVTSRWTIVGFLSLVDAEQSEIAADALVDAIIAAERADPTLGGVVRGVPVDGLTGIQLGESGPAMFADVLCHQVKLQLDVQSYEAAEGEGLGEIPGADGRLVGAVVERLQAAVSTLFPTIEGRFTFDADDDPASYPAAIVVPIDDRAEIDRTTLSFRDRVDRTVGVVIVGPSGFPAGDGALAAGGLEALRAAVREALHGWDGGIVDVPLLYAGGQPVAASPGRIAWRDLYSPSIFIEA